MRVDAILSSSFASLGLEARLREYRLKKAWAECVGDHISKRSTPTRLIGKTLYCTAASTSWMTELNFQRPSIIKKLNAILGSGAVAEIVFRLGEVALAQDPPDAQVQAPRDLSQDELSRIEKTAAPVKDPGLKELIKRAMEKSIR